MKRSLSLIGGMLAGAVLFSAGSAHAHFKLDKPASWLKEDSSGGPQKGSPCGPGGLDDASPVPASGMVTTFQAGETITVEWTDTIAHPGYFRIALAENRGDLKDPTITQDSSCSFDESKVPMGAHDNVLADGVSFRTRNGFSESAGHKFSQKVTLPNKPCEKCTLQVMQVMEMDLQVLSNCYYFHCADIKIVAGGTADAGASDAGAAADAGTPSAQVDASTAAHDSGAPTGSAGGGTTSGTTTTIGGTTSGTTPPATGGSTTGGSTTGGTAAAGGTTGGTGTTAQPVGAGAPVPSNDDDGGGCSVALGSERSSLSGLTGLLLLVGVLVRRRKQSR
jgi:MYXO-CTERM domain-containing protein